jgi:Tol biopolymer transport system component
VTDPTRGLPLAAALMVLCATQGCTPLSGPTAIPIDWGSRFSPDGTRVVFMRVSDPSRASGLYEVDAEGLGEVRLAGGLYPAWGPDGTTMAAVLDSGIWEIDAVLGQPIRLLSKDESSTRLDWSPDGKWITHDGHIYPRIGVVRIGVESGESHVIIPSPAGGARWSRDSRRIVFEYGGTYNSGPSGIYTADSTGGGCRAALLDNASFRFTDPAWFGDSIVCVYHYADGREGANGMAIADTNGSWRPFSLSGGIADYDVAGRRFVYCDFVGYEAPAGATRLFLVRVDGSDRCQLTRGLN